jgi:hypothetical protein
MKVVKKLAHYCFFRQLGLLSNFNVIHRRLTTTKWTSSVYNRQFGYAVFFFGGSKLMFCQLADKN